MKKLFKKMSLKNLQTTVTKQRSSISSTEMCIRDRFSSGHIFSCTKVCDRLQLYIHASHLFELKLIVFNLRPFLGNDIFLTLVTSTFS